MNEFRTKVYYYFVSNGIDTAWVATDEPAANACFELGEDYFEGNAGDIIGWAEESGYRATMMVDEKRFNIDWDLAERLETS